MVLRSFPRTAKAWPWLAGFVPALVILYLLLPLRGSEPYQDSWRFVGEYADWIEGNYTWEAFFAPHYVHPSAVGKVIYFAVLHWLGGNVSVLPLVGWALSLVIAACVCALLRPLWTGRPMRGAVFMLCANVAIFSAAQGEVWIWDFLFQNFIPGACLAVGILLLWSGQTSGARIVAAAALSVVAAFSFGSGYLVGLLLAPLIWHRMAGKCAARRIMVTGLWLAFVVIITWAALRSSPGLETPLSVLADRPAMRVQFVLVLLGQILGGGTVLEPQVLSAWVGALLLVMYAGSVIFVARHRSSRELVSASIPWIVLGLYGLANAALICAGRMQRSFEPALAERYNTFTLFFVLGATFLPVVVLRHGPPGARHRVWIRRAVAPSLTLLFAAHIMNWNRGAQLMVDWSKRMEQDRARLVFMNIIPLDSEWMLSRQTRPSTFRLAQFLVEHDRLRGVKLARDNRIKSLDLGRNISPESARFDEPKFPVRGQVELSGMGGESKTTAADLIIISAAAAGEEEKIVAVTAPLVPDRSHQHESYTRKHPEQFLAWSHLVSRASLPQQAHTLKAYVFQAEERVIRPMDGVHLIEGVP